MVSVLRYFLIFALLTVLAFGQVARPRFYADDPIWSVPPPTPVTEVKKRDIDALYDFMWQSFRPQGKKPAPSRGINTLGEVPDSEWFTNRHADFERQPALKPRLASLPLFPAGDDPSINISHLKFLLSLQKILGVLSTVVLA